MNLNTELFYVVNDWAGQFAWLDNLMIFFTHTITYIFPLILVLLWVSGQKELKKASLYALFSFVLAILISKIIGMFYFHPRPFVEHLGTQLVDHAPDSSFPSDHSTAAFSISFAVYWVRKRSGGYMLGLAAFTALSRVFIGVHFPADIIAGAIIGLLTSLIIYKSRHRLEPLVQLPISLYDRLLSKVKPRNNKTSLPK